MARRSFSSLALAIGFLCTVSQGSLASPTGFPICTAPGTQDQFSLAAGRRGEATIVWRDGRHNPTDAADIYGQSFDVTGRFFWAPGDTGIALCRASGVQSEPDVAVGPDGLSWTVWRDQRPVVPNGVAYLQATDRAGLSLCAVDGFPVTSSTSMSRHPRVVSTAAGSGTATWFVGRSELYVRRALSGPCDFAWGPVKYYDVAWTSDPDVHPVMIADGIGDVIAAWSVWFCCPPASHRVIYVNRIDAAGAILWTNTQTCTDVVNQTAPALTSDGSGGAIVVWESGNTGARVIRGQRLDAAGARRWGNCGKVIAGGSGDQRNPRVVPSEMSRFFVVWETGSSTNANIYAQRINFLGDTLGTRIPICTAPSSQIAPQAVAGDAGACILAWEDRRQEVVGDDGDIYAQQIESDGTILGRFNGVPACSLYSSRQYEPRIVSNGWGGAIVVWNDTRNGSADIYGQILWRNFHLANRTDTPDELPFAYRLDPVVPNPFNPSTTITYDIPLRSSILLRVYDVSGRQVRVLADGAQEDLGRHTRKWDGRDDAGGPVPSGVYYVRLIAGDYRATRRAVLLK